ncbi:hypothetical protein J6590_022436 [Homalodisca vitripennis]|nr:hypothetical protein J6590_022436 [Homalodisca vitripennis]
MGDKVRVTKPQSGRTKVSIIVSQGWQHPWLKLDQLTLITAIHSRVDLSLIGTKTRSSVRVSFKPTSELDQCQRAYSTTLRLDVLLRLSVRKSYASLSVYFL